MSLPSWVGHWFKARLLEALTTDLDSVYHMYTLNPLAALHMFHAAGTAVQIFLSTRFSSTVSITTSIADRIL